MSKNLRDAIEQDGFKVLAGALSQVKVRTILTELEVALTFEQATCC